MIKMKLFFIGLLKFMSFILICLVSCIAIIYYIYFYDKNKTYPSKMINLDLEITEDSYLFVKAKLYDNKGNFIKENVSLLLNNKKMSFNQTPNGYYGTWDYYSISSYSFKNMLKDTQQLVFLLNKNNKSYIIASIDKPKQIDKNNITYSKNKNNIIVNWKDMKYFDTLEVTINDKIIKSTKIYEKGNYKFSFLNINKIKYKDANIKFKFSGSRKKKIIHNIAYNSKLVYNRYYSLTIE